MTYCKYVSTLSDSDQPSPTFIMFDYFTLNDH